MKKLLISSTVAALALSAGLALASDDDNAKRLGIDVPRAEWLSAAQITEKLAAQGYEVRKIEAEDGVYEVKAIDKNGARLEAYVHPATGEIVRQESKR